MGFYKQIRMSTSTTMKMMMMRKMVVMMKTMTLSLTM